jgi:N-acetylglucosaminyl-diphospho-decaprenol L-rhamnosyltransferase
MGNRDPHGAQASLREYCPRRRSNLPTNIEPAYKPSASNGASILDETTAIIIDWNLPDHTVRCARALIEDGVPPARIVVVENGPTDDTWSTISSALAGCVLVRTKVNVGFAVANNIAARVVPGRAYLLVNNDAFVHRPGSVARLLARLELPRVGIVVPRLVNEDHTLQPTVVPFTTPSVALVRASGLSRFIPNRWQPRWSTHWDHSESREIDAAIAAVMAVRADTWDAVGGLDETSFMYAEDFDLCWRARTLGFASWFEANAEFVHLGGASSSARWSGGQRGEAVARAEAAMIRRHFSPIRARLALAFMRYGLAARFVCFRMIGRGLAAETCRGFMRGLKKTMHLADDARTEPDLGIEISWPRA